MSGLYERIRQYRLNKCRAELSQIGIKQSIKILEIGAGDGEEISWCVASGSYCTAVDISAESCKVIMKKLRQESMRTHADVVRADGERLPFRESLFDVVFCKAVLHHIRKPLQAIYEMRRVARDRGIVTAIDEANALNPFWHIAELIVKTKRFRKFFSVFFSGYYWEWKVADWAAPFYPWQLHYFFKKANLQQIKVKNLWLPYYVKSEWLFKAYLLLERTLEKTPIPHVLGQLFIVGRK